MSVTSMSKCIRFLTVFGSATRCRSSFGPGAPFGIGDGWHVIEQQAYADAAETIDSLDLLCSGFRPDRVTEGT